MSLFLEFYLYNILLLYIHNVYILVISIQLHYNRRRNCARKWTKIGSNILHRAYRLQWLLICFRHNVLDSYQRTDASVEHGVSGVVNNGVEIG